MEMSNHDLKYCIMYWVQKLYLYKRDYETSNNSSFTEMRVAQDRRDCAFVS